MEQDPAPETLETEESLVQLTEDQQATGSVSQESPEPKPDEPSAPVPPAVEAESPPVPVTVPEPDLNKVREALVRLNNVPEGLVPLLPAELGRLVEYLESQPYRELVARFTPEPAPQAPPAPVAEPKHQPQSGLASIGRAIFGE